MKKTIKLLLAFLLTAGAAMAQGEFPTAYSYWLAEYHPFTSEEENVWDGVIQQTPGQGMGLIARGAQKIVSTITVRDYDGTPSNKQLECEFYPNGLMKSYVADHSQKFYMYDKKWRLLSIQDQEGKVLFKYNYDQDGRLVKAIKNDGQYDYTYIYNEAGQLTRINAGNEFYFTIKDGNIVKRSYNNPESFPQTYSYDAKGRWTGHVQIGWGFEGLENNEIVVKYATGPFPISMIKRMSEYDNDKKVRIGEVETFTSKCAYTYDSKGNWTSWKLTGNSQALNCTIKRTIAYYTDEEVSAAVAEMESARNAKAQEDEQKEDLWEF